MPAGRRVVAVALTAALAVAGCESGAKEDKKEDGGQAPVRAEWAALTLPTPPGAPGRLALRDVTACAGRWYVVGAVTAADGATRPAAWTSADAQTWTSLSILPESYYGHQNVLYSAGCRAGRVAIVGAKSGGAHANPRVSTWYQRADGALVEVRARFELYGGPHAINVARIAGGSSGWMITGNRYSGAAAWVSADSAKFEIVEDAPELSSDGRGESWAADVVAVPEGWLVVGGHIGKGRIDRDPLAWRSADGATWRRTSTPATDDYDELQRAATRGDTVFAAGLAGNQFGAWRLDGDQWEALSRFGAASGQGVPSVRGLAAADGQLVAATSDGAAHGLWISTDDGRSWRTVTPPADMPAGAERAVAVFAAYGRMVLTVDDGRTGRIWRIGTPVPAG